MTQKFTILFDLDGTLVDTAPDLIRAHNHVMKKFGYPTKTLGELKNAVGKGAKAMMAKANGQWKWFDEKIQNEMTDEFLSYYGNNILHESKLINGVKEFFKKITDDPIKDITQSAISRAAQLSLESLPTASTTLASKQELIYNTMSVRVATDQHGHAATDSIMSELKNLFYTHQCFDIVPKSLHDYVYKNFRVLRSSLFLKEKDTGKIRQGL